MPNSSSPASPRSPNSSRSRIPPPPWRDGIDGARDRQSAFQSGEFKMRYVRMPIEVESPEEYGYGKIRYNLSESSIADQSLGSLGLTVPDLTLLSGEHPGCARLRELALQETPGLGMNDVLINDGAAGAVSNL